jgi:DNA-binding transcriptional LysR family regulator
MSIQPKITMIFGNIDAIKQAISGNLGISLLPYSALAFELKLRLIKELHIKGKSWSYPYSLIYNKNKYLSPASKKLIALVEKRMFHQE